MPSLKEIKTRIASVNNTRKITSAMKMVASSKLHHAQTAIQNMLPYENLLEHILKSFLVTVPEIQNEFEELRKVKRVALVVFTSNSSLCGGFNNNVLKLLQNAIDEYTAAGVEDIVVYPIGRKGEEYAVKRGLRVAGSFLALADKPNAGDCASISQELRDKFVAGEVDRVELIYHHFKSAGSQILTRKTFLPIDLTTENIGRENDRDLSSNVATAKAQEYLRKRRTDEGKQASASAHAINDNFIVEPDLDAVLSCLILRVLNLQYNKSRQQAITNELLDIVGGSVNN